jgi:hypothetical protein
MARVHQRGPDTQAGEEFPDEALDSGYLTDGRVLFHVERTLLDSPDGELLIELEDCATLELIVCSAKSLAELGMRPVKPIALAPA